MSLDRVMAIGNFPEAPPAGHLIPTIAVTIIVINSPGTMLKGPVNSVDAGRKNHNVVNCWFRFDKTFYLHVESHKAYITAPGSLTDSNWVPDSGATHHLTTDLNNLNIHSPYEGPDQIQVGNGNTLNISHTGSSYGNGTATRQE